jgi:hypothetical protein
MFKIGDEIEIIPDVVGYCPYSWTTPGSKGTIVKVGDNGFEYYIEFKFFTSDYTMAKDIFWIESEYIKLLTPAPSLKPADQKYSKIIRKMKQMEAKRKELGYKTYEPI